MNIPKEKNKQNLMNFFIPKINKKDIIIPSKAFLEALNREKYIRNIFIKIKVNLLVMDSCFFLREDSENGRHSVNHIPR